MSRKQYLKLLLIGALEVAFLILILVKALGFLKGLTWWAVLAPFWVSASLLLFVVACVLLFLVGAFVILFFKNVYNYRLL